MAIFFIWVLLSFGVAYLGDSRRIGFGWALFWALLLSPLIGFAIVLASERKGRLRRNWPAYRVKRRRRQRCPRLRRECQLRIRSRN